jgi:CheY-like chemotaxis protein
MRSGKKLGTSWFGNLLAGRKKRAEPGAPYTASKPPMGRQPAPSGRVEKPRTLHILIIDDDPQVALALKRLLHRHDVAMVHSGTEARALLAANRFDAVISDVMMPEPSGIDVYLELAAQGSPLIARFIFVTGGVQGTKAHRFLASIRNPHLDKPVDALELEHAIARVFHGEEKNNAGAG